MKLLKIVLIIALLCVPLVSYGTGSISSGETCITFEAEEPNSLNEWFYNLSLSEKIELYNYWKEVSHD